MKKKRFVGLFLLLFPICLFGVSSRLVKTDLQTDFSRLDQIVHNRNFYMVRKKQEIFNLKESLEGCTLDNDRCVIYKRLYDEYQKFNADSAIVYADKYEEISRRQGWGNLALQARLDKVMALILQGMYLKADQEMKNCAPIGRLPPQLQQKYAIADFEFTLRMLLEKASPDTEEVRARLQDCWNTYSRYIPEDCWIYDYYEALMTRHEVTGKLLSQLKTAPKPSIQAAMLEMALAKVYRDQKKSELCCYYLIRSAISDICKANRDAPALLFLMSVPQVRGDLNRAYLYAMACTENFESYGDVARSTYILRAQTMASKNFNDRLQGRIYLLVMILIFLLVAMVIVCVQFGFLYTKNKRKSVLLKQILHSNVKQRMMIERDLRVKQHTKEANMRLEEELKKRNANFLNDYLLISRYISEEARFRKKIFNLLVAGKLNPDTCAVGDLYACFSDWSVPMFQVMSTVFVQVSTISLVTPYHLVYSLMRDILAFQCQTARYLPGGPLLSNKQRDNLGLYPCFHRVIAGMSVLVVCGIRLSRIPVVFAAAAAVAL
jgi:hypothetical protein